MFPILVFLPFTLFPAFVWPPFNFYCVWTPPTTFSHFTSNPKILGSWKKNSKENKKESNFHRVIHRDRGGIGTHLCECEDRGVSPTLTTFINFQILSLNYHPQTLNYQQVVEPYCSLSLSLLSPRLSLSLLHSLSLSLSLLPSQCVWIQERV